ncbi:YciI family protein [Klebsiella sp. ZJOU C1]|uniref:YciI family protein n=1 Tax=Klebsiella sp. ZJOU C1 TaxID=3111629 RepID=UPI002D77D6D3|nr:YciI family protein [Klebsiella sp. ZJOU C1]WRR61814.1 YciI family protein [Klebsiella sp. ZJOU C1]
MKYYLCKYVPPRSDFLATMSEEECKWMKQHRVYLDKLLAQGTVVAHGPVIDGAGGYGVSLFQIPDEMEIADLTAEDPIMANGVGHYEHFPMLNLSSHAPSGD